MRNIFAHLALFGANLIYGINYSVAKDVMPDYMQPFGFILTRVLGALGLFWLVNILFVREPIDKKDIPKLILCGLFGVAINQLLFFKGLNITTPVNAAIIMTSNPILVLLISSLILKETITKNKIAGILLGIIGALILIFFKQGNTGITFDTATLWGDLMVFINAASYGVYLVLVKPLMKKYNPLTVIKWVFTFGLPFVLPVSIGEFSAIEWSGFTTTIIWEVLFVVICTTFFAYLLNIYALKQVSPSVVSTYLYLQPVIAALVAILFGSDSINLLKIGATVLIFSGVYLVSKPAKASTST